MHKKDVVKDVIEKYIKKGRDFFELTPSFLASLDELEGYSERTLKRGRTEFKNENRDIITKHSRNTASSRKKIFRYLDENPEATPKAITEALPDIEKKLIVSCRNLWKKEQYSSGTPGQEAAQPIQPKTDGRKTRSGRRAGKSVKQKIMEYLDENPTATTAHLRSIFLEVKQASINTYHSLWKSAQGDRLKTNTAKTKSITGDAENSDEMIKALNRTIEAQNHTIEVLKSQNEMLKQRQSYVFPELEGMTKDDIERVEKVIRTFIKGVKNS